MSYDVLTFTLTDREIAKDDLARDGQLRLCPPGFASDLPIETHHFPAERRQVWLQRLTPTALEGRVQKILLNYEENNMAVAEELYCPHAEDEPLHPDGITYMGLKMRFCRDCMMLMRAIWLDHEQSWLSVLDGDGRVRRGRWQSEYQHWLETRKINWVHCGEPIVLDPYRRQMGF